MKKEGSFAHGWRQEDDSKMSPTLPKKIKTKNQNKKVFPP